MSRQTGITEDGRPVLRFFDLVDTHGIPLDVVIEHMHDSGMMPDWCDFLDSARRSRWNMSRTVLKLSIPVRAIYGDDWHDQWLVLVQAYVERANGAQ